MGGREELLLVVVGIDGMVVGWGVLGLAVGGTELYAVLHFLGIECAV